MPDYACEILCKRSWRRVRKPFSPVSPPAQQLVDICSVIMLCRTFIGVIEIDPVQLLEDGLQSGITRRISAALATHLQVDTRFAPNA